MSKKTYFRMFEKDGKTSVKINDKTAATLRALADEVEAAYNEAKGSTRGDNKVLAGFINLTPVHPEKIAQWELPEGTVQLHVVSTAEIEARKSRNSGL
jgi:hypothetical protein